MTTESLAPESTRSLNGTVESEGGLLLAMLVMVVLGVAAIFLIS